MTKFLPIQFRAICYRQTSARIGHAVAKASVMRLLGVPRLPLPQLIPSYALARNRPGPADSFSPPFPLTYASSVGQTSARIGHAVAKASVMRLLGVPRLPLPHIIPSY